MFTPYPQVKGFCSKPMVLKDFVAQVKQALEEDAQQ